MPSVLRAAEFRIGLASLVLVASLSGCDMVEGIIGKSKPPLPGERIAVFAERSELEPDKDMANVEIVLPAPAVNDSWPQSGGFANYAMHNLAVGDSPQIIWTADVGAGSTSSRILTTPPVVAEGKVFAKDAQSTVSAFNADTGQLIWRVTLKPEKARDADEFGGGLAYYGGRLFVTTGFAAGLLARSRRRQGDLELDGERAGARRAAGVRRPRVRHQHRQQAAGPGRRRRLGPVAILRPAERRAMSAATARRARATTSWRRSRRASWSACASITAGRSGTNR